MLLEAWSRELVPGRVTASGQSVSHVSQLILGKGPTPAAVTANFVDDLRCCDDRAFGNYTPELKPVGTGFVVVAIPEIRNAPGFQGHAKTCSPAPPPIFPCGIGYTTDPLGGSRVQPMLAGLRINVRIELAHFIGSCQREKTDPILKGIYDVSK
jgi:hypothetical protein